MTVYQMEEKLMLLRNRLKQAKHRGDHRNEARLQEKIADLEKKIEEADG